jgi:hypothetical protein
MKSKYQKADLDSANVLLVSILTGVMTDGHFSLVLLDAFRTLYKRQKASQVCAFNWDDLWTNHFDEMKKFVYARQPAQKKANYEEKLSSDFSPFAAVAQYDRIEAELLSDSQKARGWREQTANMRHRYCLLHLTSGILRCESLYRAELSDLMSVTIPQRSHDVHPMFVMCNPFAAGKTHHGRILYGRATRHKNVYLCCVGALSLNLTMRFHYANEFSDFSVADWLENNQWFDIKLLIDIERQ